MSTILKALRRLEQDKAAETERPLQNAVVEGAAPAAPAASSRLRRLSIAVIGIALGAGGVLWLQGGGSDGTARTSPPAVASAPPAAIPAAPPAAPSPPPVATAPLPEEPALPGVASAPPPAPAAAVALPDPGAAPPSGPVAVAPPDDPAPRLESFPAPPPEPTPTRVARAELRPTAPPAELPVSAGSEVAGAVVGGAVGRSGDELPLGESVRPAPQPRQRAARPPVSSGVAVVRTVWHPKGERRTALLVAPDETTPREYREGDRVGALTLLRIEPSGVVFEKDGVELSQKIGTPAAN